MEKEEKKVIWTYLLETCEKEHLVDLLNRLKAKVPGYRDLNIVPIKLAQINILKKVLRKDIGNKEAWLNDYSEFNDQENKVKHIHDQILENKESVNSIIENLLLTGDENNILLAKLLYDKYIFINEITIESKESTLKKEKINKNVNNDKKNNENKLLILNNELEKELKKNIKKIEKLQKEKEGIKNDYTVLERKVKKEKEDKNLLEKEIEISEKEKEKITIEFNKEKEDILKENKQQQDEIKNLKKELEKIKKELLTCKSKLKFYDKEKRKNEKALWIKDSSCYYDDILPRIVINFEKENELLNNLIGLKEIIYINIHEAKVNKLKKIIKNNQLHTKVTKFYSIDELKSNIHMEDVKYGL